MFLIGLIVLRHVQLLHFCNESHVSLYCLLYMVILYIYNNYSDTPVYTIITVKSLLWTPMSSLQDKYTAGKYFRKD